MSGPSEKSYLTVVSPFLSSTISSKEPYVGLYDTLSLSWDTLAVALTVTGIAQFM